MKKVKEGISLITVAVSILVMILILTTIIISANSAVENTRKKQFNREISLIQSSWYTYISRNSGVINSLASAEINIAGFVQEEKQQFNNENIVNGKVMLKVINLDEINIENINFGNAKEGLKDRYLVSLTTGKIYYEKGFTIGGSTYYTIIQ